MTKEGLSFGDEDVADVKKREKYYKKVFSPLADHLKDMFKGKISKVCVCLGPLPYPPATLAVTLKDSASLLAETNDVLQDTLHEDVCWNAAQRGCLGPLPYLQPFVAVTFQRYR